jgi:hypothetical protein
MLVIGSLGKITPSTEISCVIYSSYHLCKFHIKYATCIIVRQSSAIIHIKDSNSIMATQSIFTEAEQVYEITKQDMQYIIKVKEGHIPTHK